MQLLTNELRKIIPYYTFWVILLIYAGLFFLFIYLSGSITINGQAAGNQIYAFPGIWMKLTYVASYFNLLLGILVIILVTDEYAFRTFRQQVIDGVFRVDLLNAKFLIILLLGVVVSIFCFLTGVGFGIPNTPDFTTDKLFTNAMHVVYYFVQAIGYMAIGLFFAFLIRKNGLAILAFLLYTKVIEPLIHWQLDDTIDQYFPMKVFSGLTPNPGQEVINSIAGPTVALTPTEAVLPAILYIGLFYLLSLLLLKSRDL